MRSGYREACISRIVYANTLLPPQNDRSEQPTASHLRRSEKSRDARSSLRQS